jgi:hypothetical protein
MSPRRSAAINHGVAWFGRPAPSFWAYALAVGRGLRIPVSARVQHFAIRNSSLYIARPMAKLGSHGCTCMPLGCSHMLLQQIGKRQDPNLHFSQKKNPNVHVVVRHMRRAHTQCSADTKYKPGPTFVEIELAVVIYPVSKILWLAELTGDTILEVGYIKKMVTILPPPLWLISVFSSSKASCVSYFYG